MNQGRFEFMAGSSGQDVLLSQTLDCPAIRLSARCKKKTTSEKHGHGDHGFHGLRLLEMLWMASCQETFCEIIYIARGRARKTLVSPARPDTIGPFILTNKDTSDVRLEQFQHQKRKYKDSMEQKHPFLVYDSFRATFKNDCNTASDGIGSFDLSTTLYRGGISRVRPILLLLIVPIVENRRSSSGHRAGV